MPPTPPRTPRTGSAAPPSVGGFPPRPPYGGVGVKPPQFAHAEWNAVFRQFPIMGVEPPFSELADASGPSFDSIAALAAYVAPRVAASPIVRRTVYYPPPPRDSRAPGAGAERPETDAGAAEPGAAREAREAREPRAARAPEAELSEYERARLQRIAANNAVLHGLGLSGNSSFSGNSSLGLGLGVAANAPTTAPIGPKAPKAPSEAVSRWETRFTELVALYESVSRADREAQREAQGSEFPPPGPLRDWVRTQIARLDTLVPPLRLRLTQLPFWPELRAAAACSHYTLRSKLPASAELNTA